MLSFVTYLYLIIQKESQKTKIGLKVHSKRKNLIMTKSSKQVALCEHGHSIVANPLVDSSIVYYFVEIAHPCAAYAPVLHQNGKAPALHADMLTV